MKFNSPERALKWAYETINVPLKNFDHNAQAVQLIDLCERILPTLHMAYVRIQFGREASGLHLLSYHFSAQFESGVRSRRSIELIVRAYCGEKVGLREIRKSLACGMLKAVSLRNRAYDTLDVIHAQAMDRLRMEMDARGLLNSLMAEQA